VTTSNPVLRLRTGFEVELLAPRGSSRWTLADELSRRARGNVRRVFHTDSEPSLVPDMGQFLHLTPGFEVLDARGHELCTLVDDITIAAELDGAAGPRAGWYRLLTDDVRLLRLIARHADPSAAFDEVLDPVAGLFGVQTEHLGAALRVRDIAGATVALAAPLPGERERPCEIVTPPLERDHLQHLEELLTPARELGFTVPVEAAVHLHVDAEPFRNVAAFSNVVRLFSYWRSTLWDVLGTNPACRRLSALPPALLDLVERPPLQWAEFKEAARRVGLTKFADVNLVKVVADNPDRHTLEVRLLPGSIEGSSIMARAAVVEALLLRCMQECPLPRPSSGDPSESARELLALTDVNG
jgi:hypothetical protein